VRNVHVMLHKALSDAVAWGYVTEYVADQARPPKVGRRPPTVWTPAQLRRFLQAATGDRFYPADVLSATTGRRRAELCGLRWSAVDLQASTLAIEASTRVVVNGQAQDSDGKTGNALRLLSIDRTTADVLTQWRSEQGSERAFFERDYQDTDRVFTWEDGRPVHPDVLRQRFNRLSARCSLPHIRLESRPGARFRCCHRPVSPDRSPNPPCRFLGNGLSTVSAVRRGSWSARGLGSCCPGRRNGTP
jgi:integrase